MDATLREIANLVTETHRRSRKRGTHLDFRLIFPEYRGPSYQYRSIGSVTSGECGEDDNKTLSECHMQFGDYMDIAIIPPGPEFQPFHRERGHFRRERQPFRRDY